MTVFRVWAPNANKVELKIDDQLLPMQAGLDGEYTIDVPEAKPGSDYQFVLDNGIALPDPRSAYQPQGVHGPSRLVNQEEFQWTDQNWRPPPLPSGVIYE